MKKMQASLLLLPAVALALPAAADAQIFGVELLNTRDQIAGGGTVDNNVLIGGIGNLAGDTYAVTSRTNSSDGSITTGVPGSDFTVEVDGADLTFAGIESEGFTANGVLPTVDGGLLFADSLNRQIIRYVPGSAPSVVADEADLTALTGGTSARPTGSAALPGGGIVFYESTSDSLLTSSTGGSLSTLISSPDLVAALGDDVIDGIAVAGNDLVIASGDSDVEGVFVAPASGGTPTRILSAGDFEAIFGDGDGNVGFRNGVTVGNDGLVYLYESDADSIFRFDLADPTGSLELVLTDADLIAGAGTDIIGGLVPLGDSAGFYTLGGTRGLYQITETIPEPASLALLGLGGLMLRRRR